MLSHILLAEDDPAIAAPLQYALQLEQWQVTWCQTGQSVIPQIYASLSSPHPLAAVILDIGLPDISGLTVCQQIRQDQRINTLPILFLTARSDEIDRIVGLEVGADDYCAKPFSPREIIARLKAIWRRDAFNQNLGQSSDTHSPESQTAIPSSLNATSVDALLQQDMQYRDFDYIAATYQLNWQNQPLDLSKTELRLLLTLLQAPNCIFSREQLLEAISDHPEHRLLRTIDSHIKTLRQKLASIDADTQVIVTHRGFGYGLAS